MKVGIAPRMAAVAALLAGAMPAAEMHTGWWRGRKITYKVVDGRAIWQGDIVLGRAGEIPSSPIVEAAPKDPAKDATFIGLPNFLWPNGTVPYVIAATVPARLRQSITTAIQIYTDNTPIRWVPRTTETDYIRFKDEPASANECGSSYVGKQGGQQEIDLNVDTTACDLSAAVHEMGHAIGFEHEQTRANRNYYIHVRYDNIDKNAWGEYDQDLTQIDLLPYEYGSIMHYGAFDFQRNNFNTIETIPLGIPIAHTKGLSAGDIEAVRTLYGQPSSSTTVATNPPGLKVIIDGATVTTPQTFDWAPGTRHTLNVPPAPQSSVAGSRYVYARWSNDGPQLQTVVASSANRILTANFAAQYRVQTLVGSGGGGTVSVTPTSPDGFYTQGTPITITATPNAGFTFLRWDAAGQTSIFTSDSGNPAVFTVDIPDLQYIADFTRSPVTTIATNIPGVTATVDGQTIYPPTNFAWTPGSTHTIAIKDTIQPAGTTGLPSRFIFQNWSNGGTASQTVAAGAAPTTITAIWTRQFLVTANVNYPDPNGSNGGDVTLSPRSPDCGNPGPNDCYYDQGATVTVTARPTNPYAFAGWGSNTNFGEHSDDLPGPNNGMSSPSGILQVNDQVIVTANFQIPGRLNPAGITSAANYVYTALAPGEIITIFGLQLGPGPLTTLQVSGGVVTNTLAQTRVLFDGAPAPLVYVSANQISAVVPYAVARRTRTSIQVEYQGRAGNAVSLPVTAAYPALFTLDSSGGGQGAILNQDSSVNSKLNPAGRGSIVSLYGTGEGMTAPAGVDGRLAIAPLPKPVLPVRVTIAGRDAQIQYAGAAPGDVAGVFQINAFIPADCPSGAVPVAIAIGDSLSPDNVTIAVQ